MSSLAKQKSKRKVRPTFLSLTRQPSSPSRRSLVQVGRKRGKSTGRSRGRSSSRMGGNRVSAPRETVVLNYTKTYSLVHAATSGCMSYYINPNSAFQIDAFTTSTTPGFNAFASRYASYRVKSYHGTIQFANSTIQISTSRFVPLTTNVCHSNTNLGITPATGGAIVDIQAFTSLARNTEKTLSSPGGPCSVHRFKRTIASVTGESTNQPGYKALVNAAPTLLTYLVFGCSWDPINIPAGDIVSCEVTVRVNQVVEFLDYIDTLTSLEGPKTCAACEFLKGREYVPCICETKGECALCGWTRPCTEEYPLPSCPREVFVMDLEPPSESRLQRSSSHKDLYSRSIDESVAQFTPKHFARSKSCKVIVRQANPSELEVRMSTARTNSLQNLGHDQQIAAVETYLTTLKTRSKEPSV